MVRPLKARGNEPGGDRTHDHRSSHDYMIVDGRPPAGSLSTASAPAASFGGSREASSPFVGPTTRKSELEIFWTQASALCHPNQHTWTEFLVVVEGKHEIRPAVRRESDEPSQTARYSRGEKRDVQEFAGGLGVIEPIGKHPECEGLDTCNRLISRCAVAQHAGKVRDFGNPATIVFELDFDSETVAHGRTVARPANRRPTWHTPDRSGCDSEGRRVRPAVGTSVASVLQA